MTFERGGISVCQCGDSWWELEAMPYATPGLLIDGDGQISWYSGRLVCQSCRRPWEVPVTGLCVVRGAAS